MSGPLQYSTQTTLSFMRSLSPVDNPSRGVMSAYSRTVRWDRFFEDLEDQLDSEWEAERAALDSEAERLRLARLGLRDRLRSLCTADGPQISVELLAGAGVRGRLGAVGADWVGVIAPDERAGVALLPLAAVVSFGMPQPDLLRSARADAATAAPTTLRERMTLGFVLRDVARRRMPVAVQLCDGRTLTGTIDRALADHLDLALHDGAEPRRAGAVSGMRMIPLAAVGAVRLERMYFDV